MARLSLEKHRWKAIGGNRRNLLCGERLLEVVSLRGVPQMPSSSIRQSVPSIEKLNVFTVLVC